MNEARIQLRELHPGQLRVKASTARFRVGMFGRQWGKNVLAVDSAIHPALQGQSIGWFEPTYKYFTESWRDLVGRLRVVAKRVDDQEKRIELVTGGLIEGWTCDTPDPGRSRHYHGVIINEAGIIRGLQEIWEQAIRPTLLRHNGWALFFGTPKGRSHDFSMLYAKATSLEGWAAFRGPTAENPYISATEIADARRELPPEVFAQEYEGIPAPDGGNPFGQDAIAACARDITEPGAIVCWGWDFARAEDWTVGVALDRKYQVVRTERWQHVPWPETERRVAEITGATPAWGDSTGVGDAVIEHLQYKGCPIIGIPFSRPMKQTLMQRLATAIHEKKLRFPDGVVRSELDTFGYVYRPGGVRYEAPSGLHDDCVMALSLAVYGRDQFGPMAEPAPVGTYTENVHPGFEVDEQRRKKPWEGGWQPEVVDESPYAISEDTEKLDWLP